MQKTCLGLLLACLLPLFLFSQKPPALKKFWVEFADKNNSPYCTCRPWEFLSARALERRARAGIPVVENDLPPNPGYLSALKISGVRLHNSSRWLNAATVIADDAAAANLRQLPFVKSVDYIGMDLKPRNPANRPAKKRKPLTAVPLAGKGENIMGYASLQNSLLNLVPLYLAGARGQGIWVAVMDGGFTNADTIPLFDSVALQGRLFPGWDFVERDKGVFEGAQHGTSVLSVMAGNLPGYFVGGAPDATYFLLKTEDTGGEYPVEEANWIAGAEWADSLGADLINASLGYTSFTDTTLNHTYSTLNGKTAIGSRGAAIAATKGMIICNSAGNEGDNAWHYIGVPADAPGLIAVGAIDHQGKHAAFSSFGPTPDGRFKPDLVAPGDQVVTAGSVGPELGISSGTSLASPMLVGAIAALWSAYPEKTAAEILEAVFASADQSDEPDNERGYGLPDLAKAWLSLGGYRHGQALNDAREGLFADEGAGAFSFLVFETMKGQVNEVELRNWAGQSFPAEVLEFHKGRLSTLKIRAVEQLPAGAYQVVVKGNDGSMRMLGLVFS